MSDRNLFEYKRCEAISRSIDDFFKEHCDDHGSTTGELLRILDRLYSANSDLKEYFGFFESEPPMDPLPPAPPLPSDIDGLGEF